MLRKMMISLLVGTALSATVDTHLGPAGGAMRDENNGKGELDKHNNNKVMRPCSTLAACHPHPPRPLLAA